jgi:hypothetical protein
VFSVTAGVTWKYPCNPVRVLGKLSAHAFAQKSLCANESTVSGLEGGTRYLRPRVTGEAEISAH